MTIKLERNVPLPARHTKPEVEEMMEAFSRMKVGDSVGLTKVKIGTISIRAHSFFGRGNYAVRRMPKGYRVWKISEKK